MNEKVELPTSIGLLMEEYYTKQLSDIYEQMTTESDDILGSDVKQQASSTRDIFLNYKPPKQKYPQNVVKTQKYNWFTFLPLSILYQFKIFSNQYFLFISLTQIFPILQINLAFTYYAPLIIVVAISVSKEFWDELSRYRRDKKVNSQKYETLSGKMVKSSDLTPGDIVILSKDQRAPADVVVLQTKDERGFVYIRTDSLDGETDWKTRSAIPQLQSLPYRSGINVARGITQVSAPIKDIYKLIARYVHLGAASSDFSVTQSHPKVPATINQSQTPATMDFGTTQSFQAAGRRTTVPLGLENSIWRDCVVANSECVCQVIYTGRETRGALNTGAARIKVGKTDVQMNLFVKGLFIFLVCVSAVFSACSADRGIIAFLRFFIIYSAIIPVSLKVAMELGKLLVSFGIARDKALTRIQVNSTSIPEQLGKITHLFSDKTGTLTKNVMQVVKLVYGDVHIAVGSEEVLKALHGEQIQRTASQAILGSFSQNESELTQNKDFPHIIKYSEIRQQMYQQKQQIIHSLDNLTPKERLTHFVRAMSICHSVYIQDGELLCSSPDEVALVKFAAQCGEELTARDDTNTQINGNKNYAIKYVFPFNSVTKRMGIVIYDEVTRKHIFYVKGADTVISKMLIQKYSWLSEKLDALSQEGLRTLVFAFRELDEATFDDFRRKYQIASSSMTNRDQMKLEAENELFKQLFLIGVCGVEDQLQDGVPKTLEMLRSAGVRTWILSGDKVETIQCIALSARLIDPQTTPFHVIQGISSCQKAFKAISQVQEHECLVIDGTTLQALLGSRPVTYHLTHKLVDPENETIHPLSSWQRFRAKSKEALMKYFFGRSGRDLGDEARHKFAQITSKLPAVCCCRCSPDQKALICALLGRFCASETAGIGDGANDVALLTAAAVGFGVFGKEGQQAAMASDFAIGEFKDLQQLIFWHGRGSYKNTVECCQFIIQRGMCSSFAQAWFEAVYWFAPMTLFNGIQMLGYAAIFNILPVICMYCNEDVDYRVAMTYPELYAKLLQGRLLSARTFFMWNVIAFWLSISCVIPALFLLKGRMDALVLVSFTAMNTDQLILICLTVQRWSWPMIITQLLSLLIYWLSLFLQLDSFPLSYVLSLEFYYMSLAVIAASGGILAAVYLIIKCVVPDEVQKLQFTQERSVCCGGCRIKVHSRSSTGRRYFNI